MFGLLSIGCADLNTQIQKCVSFGTVDKDLRGEAILIKHYLTKQKLQSVVLFHY